MNKYIVILYMEGGKFMMNDFWSKAGLRSHEYPT